MSYRPARTLLFLLPPEAAHTLTFAALEVAGPRALQRMWGNRVPSLPTRAFGLDFANPVGLAAGLDKNADHVDVLGALGFGFIEVGTVTPRPQRGNPRPRIFRLAAKTALINRMGFNNAGVDHAVARLARRRYTGVVGVNIGKNADTPLDSALDDYLHCLERVHGVADYVTVNISSPNTPGLRALQSGPALDDLLGPLTDLRGRLDRDAERRVPLLVKIAPDLDDAGIAAIADSTRRHGIDGLIATNTSTDRTTVTGLRHAEEEGGLSGAPMAKRSTATLRNLDRALGGDIPLIGVGGIVDGRDARDKREAGASLVQLYTGLIYRGPTLIREAVEAWTDS